MSNNIFLLAVMLLVFVFNQTALAQPVVEVEDDNFAESDSPTSNDTTGSLSPLEEVELPEPVLSTGENGERQTYLTENEPAPWAGVLLNPEAIAFIISEWESFRLRAAAALRAQRQADWSRLQLETSRLQLRLQTQEREHEIIVNGLESENRRLIQIHENYVQEQNGGFWNSDIGQVVKYGLIILGSAAVGVVVGYLSSSLSN